MLIIPSVTIFVIGRVSGSGASTLISENRELKSVTVEIAFGGKWAQFKNAREIADPQNRFLSGYFKSLLYG